MSTFARETETENANRGNGNRKDLVSGRVDKASRFVHWNR